VAMKYQVIALSSNDIDGSDTSGEPELTYLDALKTATELQQLGKAFRVHVKGELSEEKRQRFLELGALL
jgi:hypothetical protein